MEECGTGPNQPHDVVSSARTACDTEAPKKMTVTNRLKDAVRFMLWYPNSGQPVTVCPTGKFFKKLHQSDGGMAKRNPPSKTASRISRHRPCQASASHPKLWISSKGSFILPSSVLYFRSIRQPRLAAKHLCSTLLLSSPFHCRLLSVKRYKPSTPCWIEK